ncbi:MAG: DNA primase, partial [Pirellulales bacterium]|nr:DNA primase [Pirellulales bacterium]
MSSGSLDVKEQVRQAVDIVDLVGHYIQLRRQGRGYVGLCPWHDDSRPSLQVNPERQSFKCWVCDIGGDVFSFIMQMEGVSFREALEILAERAGIELQARQAPRPGTPEAAGDKQTLYKAMAWAESLYHKYLLESPDAEAARRYLAERCITDESIEKFHIGFAPDRWEWILSQAEPGQTDPNSPRAKVLEAVGLLGRREGGGTYDRFRGRVLFSIRDTQNRPVGLGGRVLPEFADEKSAKYYNSTDTPLFSKSNLLYGLDIARQYIHKKFDDTALVMEGYTDVIMAHQYGFENAVAVLGTALGE